MVTKPLELVIDVAGFNRQQIILTPNDRIFLADKRQTPVDFYEIKDIIMCGIHDWIGIETQATDQPDFEEIEPWQQRDVRKNKAIVWLNTRHITAIGEVYPD